MAVLTRGVTFASNGQVTNTLLHTLVDGGAVSNIVRGDANADTAFVTIQTTAPTSPKTGEVWYDTTSVIARIYDGTNWVILGRAELLTNKSGAQRVAGDVVVVYTAGTDRAFTTTTTANDPLVLGVVLTTVASNAQGIVLMPGAYCPTIKVDGTTAAGDFLSTSATATKATPSSVPAKGSFAIAMSADAGGVCSGILMPGTGGLQGSASVQAALDGATSPSASNVFVTASENTKEHDPRQRHYMTDDFHSITPYSTAGTIGPVTSERLYSCTPAAAGTTGVAAIDVDGGAVRLKGANALLSTGDGGAATHPFLATKTGFKLRMRFAPYNPAGDNYVGLFNSSNHSAAATHYLRIKWTGTGNFIFQSAAGAGVTTVDTGIAAANGVYHDFELRRTGATTYDVYVDNVNKGTLTATVPTALMALGAESGGSDEGMDLDYWQASNDR